MMFSGFNLYSALSFLQNRFSRYIIAKVLGKILKRQSFHCSLGVVIYDRILCDRSPGCFCIWILRRAPEHDESVILRHDGAKCFTRQITVHFKLTLDAHKTVIAVSVTEGITFFAVDISHIHGFFSEGAVGIM